MNMVLLMGLMFLGIEACWLQGVEGFWFSDPTFEDLLIWVSGFGKVYSFGDFWE